jgi:DNA ligase-1
MTEKYPDLVALIPQIRAPETESFIMEGEVVAVDDQGSVKTFQTLAGRGKKNVGLSQIKVQVCLFAFDLMFLNGEVHPLSLR